MFLLVLLAPATLTIQQHEKPVAVRVGGGAWQKVAADKTAVSTVKAPAGGKAVAIDVKTHGKTIRRWAVVLPDQAYRLVGNPCAFWGLEVDAKAEAEERLQVDASALSPKLFPLVVGTTEDDGEPDGVVLDAPGMSAPIELPVSAMCSRSGTHVVVYSRATKRRLFSETVIPQPGALHTLKLGKGFTITVAR